MLRSISENASADDARNIHSVLSALKHYPNRDGSRESYAIQQKFWQLTLEALTTEAQSDSSQLIIQIQSPLLQTRCLQPDLVKTLLKFQFINDKGAFQTQQMTSLPGNHLVIPLAFKGQKVHLKIFPEFPGVEAAVHILYQLIVGHGSPFVEVSHWHINMQGYPLLISQTVEGEPLHEVLGKNPRALDQLNHKNYSQLFLMAVLTNPEDGKPDNFIATYTTDARTQTKQLYLTSIDNDRTFVPAFENQRVRVKTILFCCDQMQQAIDPEAREEFLSLNPLQVLQNWLSHIEKLNHQFLEIFGEKIQTYYQKSFLGKETERSCVLLMLRENTIGELYEKIQIIQDWLIKKPEITHFELLAKIRPSLANHYKNAFIQVKENTPLARFDYAVGQEYQRQKGKTAERYTSTLQMDSYIHSVRGSAPQVGRNMWHKDLAQAQLELKRISEHHSQPEYAKRELFQGIAQRFDCLPSSHIKEQIVNSLDFAEITSADQPDLQKQRFILKSMQRVAFRKLVLNNCLALDETLLKPILMASPDLVELNINGCKLLHDESISSIAKYCPQLEKLSLNDMVLLKKLSEKKLTGVNFLNFPKLHTLSITRCDNLTTIQLKAPELQEITICECRHLNFLHLDTPKVRYFHVRGHCLLTDETLKKALHSCSQLQKLVLENCIKERSTENGNIFLLQQIAIQAVSEADFSKCKIGVLIISALGSLLSSNEIKLTALNLANNTLGDFEISLLCQGLLRNNTLITLNLENNQKIAFEGIKALALVLEENKSLTTINFTNNLLDSAGAQALALALQHNRTLTKFIFEPQQVITTAAWQNIRSALLRNQALAEIQQNPNLAEIAITGGLNDEDLFIVLEALRIRRACLEKLILSDNNISNRGADLIKQILSESLTVFEKLKLLNLSSNQIDEKSGLPLLRLAYEGRPPFSILLENNPIKSNVIAREIWLFKIRQNPWLDEINIAGQQLEDADLKTLLNKLYETGKVKLKSLLLANNHISDEGLQSLKRLFNDDQTLTLVDLSGNPLKPSGIKYLRELAERNLSITKMKTFNFYVRLC